MANHALAIAEAALRARQLDRTLTTALPPPGHRTAEAVATGVAALDACLHPTARGAAGTPGVDGGLPRGHLSEIAGPQSSGRTTLLLQIVAAAARRGEIAALVDTFDRFDVASAVSAGVDLDRLLWIRGAPVSCLPTPDSLIDRGLKALNLVVQAGGFGVVAIDLADAPPAALGRVPFTTWLRIQRVIEGSDTACVIVAPRPLARSAGGLTLSVTARPQWTNSRNSRPPASGLRPQSEASGLGPGALFLAGFGVTVRVVSPRRQVDGEVTIAAVTGDSR